MSAEGGDVVRDSGFRAPWWLRHAHLQTLWAGVVRRAPVLASRATELELPDGDALRLVWGPDAPGPVVVILHGLGGCARSPYVLGLQRALAERGMQSVVMEFRGAGGHLNRLPRFFHAGETGDLAAVVAHVRERLPGRRLAVTGFSMGGIVLLNHLADYGDATPIDHAVAVSSPLDLAACADYLRSGFRRVYDRHLTGILCRMVARKHREQGLPLPPGGLAAIRSLRAFDDALTAPVHGFRDANDYYARCSPLPRLRGITHPVTLIHALDDPFVPRDTIPAVAQLGPRTVFLQSQRGGHVGFVAGPGRYWLDGALATHLASRLSNAAEPMADAAPETSEAPDEAGAS